MQFRTDEHGLQIRATLRLKTCSQRMIFMRPASLFCRFALFLSLTGALCANAGDSPLNVILLVADDLGYGELSCQNPQTDVPTPHIDSIAAEGVRFTDGYVTAPFCAASRAGLLTGRYQTRFGFEFNPIGARNEDPGTGLPKDEKTLADLLKDQGGYTTALIGKWHLGGTADFHPIRRGFDTFFGFMHEGHYYVSPPWDGVTTWLRRKRLPGGGEGRWTSGDGRTIYSTHLSHNEPDYDADNPICRAGQPVAESENLTDALTREAMDFVGRNVDRPFFLYLAYNAVHSPLQGADEYMKKFSHIEDIQRRIFAAMLANLDDGVGRVLAQVKEKGLEQKTLVFFLSDNGGPTRELTSSNAPLRDGKGSLYEGGIRVPFLMKWPGTVEGGRVFQKPVLSLDIFATALARAGAVAPEGKETDGVDLLPFLTGRTDEMPHEEIFWRVGKRAALRMGDWKLVRNPGRGQDDSWQLYRVSEDIGETSDRAASEPERLREMIARWEARNREMAEPLWR